METRIQQLEDRLAALEQLIPQTPIPDRLYLPAEAAVMLRCGKSNLYDLIMRGELAVTRVGVGNQGMRIKGSALKAFLEARTTGGPKPKKSFKHIRAYLE